MNTFAQQPNSVYWELTRRCRFRCLHCRLDAGEADPAEMKLSEALDVADQLVALGVKYVVLTGGEPTLYRGWEEIARRLSEGGTSVRLFTDGYRFDRQMLATALGAGIERFSVSLDGPQSVHDRLRPLADPRSASPFARAVAAIESIVGAGAKNRVVTQVNRQNIEHLEELYRLLVELKVRRWQVQLCQMSGRASRNRDELLCDPRDLEKIIRILLLAAREKKILAPLHCSVGYLTEEEPVLRGRETRGKPIWKGCEAGRRTFAITPTGGIKGCVALPDEFIHETLTAHSLAVTWRDPAGFSYSRQWSEEILGDSCSYCSFGKICRAGCPAVAYGATGSIGVNPFCLRLVRGK